MKKILFLILCIQCSVISGVYAQRQITSTRFEVTRSLDENPDPEAMKMMEKYKPAVDSLIAPVLGESLVGMSAGRPESLLSNWSADVLMEFSDFADGKKADLGIVNVGGLRNNMPKGIVRKGDIMLISPFNNTLALVQLRGTDLMGLFENIASVHGEGVSREVQLVITEDGKLVDAKVSGQPIEPERIYRVITVNYLAEGNDHLTSFKKSVKQDLSSILVRDAMMQFVKRHKTITSAIEGRIKVQ